MLMTINTNRLTALIHSIAIDTFISNKLRCLPDVIKALAVTPVIPVVPEIKFNLFSLFILAPFNLSLMEIGKEYSITPSLFRKDSLNGLYPI